MANLSHSESRRLYSWWWDSHICPKNSKWLQENLTDIDAKVKAMIKLIEEDADSFARRAEMYYKKRPELMKLVEEFYRAYRALAERYDYAMGELRQANKTTEEAFPNQAHYMQTDDSSCGSSGLDAESLTSGPGESHPTFSESEIQTLRNDLAKTQSDKDAIYLQFQKSLEKLSEMERDLNKAQRDAGGLDERASRAEVEVEILKEALAELKAEKDTGLVQYNQSIEVISRLETKLSVAQLESKGLDVRASKAEIEAKNLKQELTRLEAEKDAGLIQYTRCLEKISVLEANVTLAEDNSRMLNEQLESAELEVKALRKNLAELNEEKESVAVLYHQCLEKISKLENEISRAQETTEQLNSEIKEGAEKLKSAEEHCDVLEKSNQYLKSEAENLALKIAMKDQALLEKHGEIERLQTLMHEEHSHFLQIESALQTLQKLYSQSQQEQRTLALELKCGLQLLNDIELSKQGFKEEMEAVIEENRTLHELSFSSTRSLQKQQMEIFKLKEIKEKLERELAVNAEESNTFQDEVHQIKDDIQHLNDRYQAMLEQLQSLGLNPTCFAASVKDLQNENSKLKEDCKMERDEKEALHEKSKEMDELLIENAFMEFSLSGLNRELDGLRATVKIFQESCQILQEEKSILADEKSTLLSQLQIVTQSVQKLLEKNTLLEKSLSDAKIELEGLKAKSSDLEEFCNLLNNEKHNLLKERRMLVSQLESVEAKLSDLEKRFTELEEKYADVEKEKESTDNQVEELRASIFVQKEKHASHKHSSEARLATLENLIHVLQEEQQLGKVEFEEELHKAVNAQLEMFIMQNCIEELEQMNLALLTECEKHVEASKFSDKVISELETENLMQLMEEEILLHQIRKFKMVMHQVCGALQIDPDDRHDNGINQEEIPTLLIFDKIEGLKSSLEKNQEEKQQLLVENSVLITSLQKHQSEGEKHESEKKIMEEELENLREQNVMLQKEKADLLEKNMQLRTEVASGEERENISKTKLAALQVEMIDLRRTNQVFQDENDKMLEEKNSLFRNVLDLKDAISAAEDENSVIFHEVLALRTLSLVYESFLTENVTEQKALTEQLSNLSHLNSDLNQELGALRKKFQVKEEEIVYLNKSTERMDKELLEVKNSNCSLSHQIENSKNLLKKKDAELLEMETRLEKEESMNAEFCRYIEKLEMEQKESTLVKDKLDKKILELSESCMNQEKEIEHLNEVNKSSLCEMKLLLHEVEQHKAREETLNLQLLDKTNEFKLWEVEAAAFYFDLQISSITETLLESKVTELATVCKILDDESAAKSLVIEQMESEIGELKGKLSAYIPFITSLKEDFASLEHTYLLWTDKASVVGNEEQKDAVIETCHQENSHQSLRENESTLIPEGISDLMSMQIRIRAVEKVLIEELENLTANAETRALAELTEDSNLESTPYPAIDNRKVAMEVKEDSTHDFNAWRRKPESRVLVKDIQLDHNSGDLDSNDCEREHSKINDHEISNKRSNPPIEDAMACHHRSENSGRRQNYSSELEIDVDEQELSKTIQEAPENGKRRILERLASDAQKLAILKISLEDLKKKPETKKKSKEVNEIEYETVKRHIEEVEAAVMQQVGINDQLAKKLESTTCSEREILTKDEHIQRRVIEQARRDSEQIGRLQFEVQNIQYILVKMADEKNNKGKSRTGVLLRDFIQIGRKNSRRRSKVCVCGCSKKPSTNED